ncbi:DEAD/DEAH box helicase [Sphingomicrobium lutaoense]|uniref:ATP-dependent helicase YprA (DUF1998 family) n=1 Tax=Sphingomicrobium lutaoense TaxID=515949 RepID=A0A839YT34_9SPHN|nr:DEAD/DEAH box helicase [Sphingomicrobium lutaoense]MBB3763441.1 ATP-dependent helicase YprA (DUF1998 family) [Sphingomicrobium lutaoense]
MTASKEVRNEKLSPIEVHEKLQKGLAEAMISRANLRHDTLNAFLREQLTSAAPSQGALLSDQIFQAAPSYVSSGQSPNALTSLLHPRTIAAITNNTDKDSLPFDYPAYAHQLEAWKQLSGQTPKSVLVSSGTGSGKTECFLVPMLDDLVRETVVEGPLTGVRALMLYPLNALIASQEKRLTAWTKPLKGDVRFALYNGLMKTARKAARDKAEQDVPEQVLYRETLRANPPPILVTNQTMLEYMTIRREDRPILEASKGKLRWIVIDEAHSYIGSAAAELSLLLRRVMEAFEVEAANVRFVATSATIGSADDREAILALQRFLADLAGVPLDRVHVVVGKAQPLDLKRLEQDVSDPAAMKIARALAKEPQSLSRLRSLTPNATKGLLELSGHSSSSGHPILPMRAHSFARAVAGLWTCINRDCNGGRKPATWPFGPILFDEDDACPHCNSMVFELESCLDCGEVYLAADDNGHRIVPRRRKEASDEFREDGIRDGDWDEKDDEANHEARGHARLISLTSIPNASPISFDLQNGEIDQEVRNFYISDLDEGRCPSCRTPRRQGRPPTFPFRFGAPFLTQNAAPLLLQGVSLHPQATDRALPFDGRQLISFSDSRQGTARFAANLETNGERGFVRGFIYHAVQKAAKSSVVSEEEKSALLKERAIYAANQHEVPAFKDKVVEIDAKLGGGTPSGIKWTDLIPALAAEPAIAMMSKVWDLDRSERFHDNNEALARFMLLREMARRPRNANSMETLGLARLRFEVIERLASSDLPETVEAKNFGIEDWREFLYYLVDYLRGYFAIDVEEEDARWMPGRARPRNVIGPGDPPGQLRDIIWPSAKSKGAQTDAVKLLAMALDLDLSSDRDRHIINETMRVAWGQLLPLLEGVGGTYRLRLEKTAQIEAITKAWQCPATRRILPRLVFGRSPNAINAQLSSNNSKKCEVVFPKLPRTRPLKPDGREEISKWLQSDAVVAQLRDRMLWGDLHDQAALAMPYLRAEEHSAQQPPYRLREFEEQFKQGDINLLACSTTMEMGVDIGSIEAVMMTNVPPSIANYNQRAGRAGRRGQGFSSSLTIARNTPLDRETFFDPIAYLGRKLASPRVSLDSDRIAQRHANAFLLARWFSEVDGQFAKTKCGDFFGCRVDLQPFEGLAPVDDFIEWLGRPSTAVETEGALQRLLRGTGLASDKEVWSHTSAMFKLEAGKYRGIWDRLKADHQNLTGPAKKAIEFQARRLCREFLLKELANRALIPGSGFPTSVVPFDTLCAESQKAQARKPSDEEGARDTRYECPTRNADIAIREYAPGAEVVVDGLVWRSEGVTLNWQSPIDSGQKEPQNLRWAWWCDHCGGAGSGHKIEDHCLNCGESDISTEQFLEPAGFRVDWNAKPHADTNNAVYIEPKKPIVSAGDVDWQPLLIPQSGRVRATHEGHIYHHSRGPEDDGYEICLECGRAASAGSGDLEDHRPLTPRNGQSSSERCRGNDAAYAITRSLALGHEVLTDVVEVQIPGVETEGAAWAFGAALRESLTRWLGIEPRELGISVAARDGELGQRVASIYLFDEASGGAGYSPRLLENVYPIFERAADILDCSKDCEKACASCILLSDLHKQQEILDRKTALVAVREFLKVNAELPDDDRAVADARPINDAANAILLRARGEHRISVFAPGKFDLNGLRSTKMRTFFATAAARGVPVTLVLDDKAFEQYGEVERRALRDASIRHEFELGVGSAQQGKNKSHRIAELLTDEGGTAFFSRDESSCHPGRSWGIGRSHPTVEGAIGTPTAYRVIDPDELERPGASGDLVEVLDGFAQCPVEQFGRRFGSKLKNKLETIGAWKPNKLARITYVDRYLKAPLQVLLLLRTCEALARELAANETTEVDIETWSITNAGYPNAIFHDWCKDNDRYDVTRELGHKLGLDVEIATQSDMPHGRKLVLEYTDGEKVAIFLDLGFGYWRASGKPFHDFRKPPAYQAGELVRSKAAVSAIGESYIAVARI